MKRSQSSFNDFSAKQTSWVPLNLFDIYEYLTKQILLIKHIFEEKTILKLKVLITKTLSNRFPLTNYVCIFDCHTLKPNIYSGFIVISALIPCRLIKYCDLDIPRPWINTGCGIFFSDCACHITNKTPFNLNDVQNQLTMHTCI